jgi:hypothetical protein
VTEAAVFHLPAPRPSPEPHTSTGEHDGKSWISKPRYDELWHHEIYLSDAQDGGREAQDHLAATGETTVKIL